MVERSIKTALGPLIGSLVTALLAYACWLMALTAYGPSVSSPRLLGHTRLALTLITFALFAWSFIAMIRSPHGGRSADDLTETTPAGLSRKVFLGIGALLVIGLAVLPGTPLSAGASIKPKPTVSAGSTGPALSRLTMTVRNLTCRNCADSLQETLEELPGVVQAQVQVHPPVAVIDYQPDKVTTTTLLSSARQAGFPGTIRK